MSLTLQYGLNGASGVFSGMSMISNERSSTYGSRPYGQPKTPVPEETLKTEKIQIERKTFILAFKENRRRPTKHYATNYCDSLANSLTGTMPLKISISKPLVLL
jgi:hypothetical protein